MDLLATHHDDARRAHCASRYQIERYLADELSEDESTAFRGHLAQCRRCRDLLAAFKADNAAFLDDHPFDVFYERLEHRMAETAIASEKATRDEGNSQPLTREAPTAPSLERPAGRPKKGPAWWETIRRRLMPPYSPIPLGIAVAALAFFIVRPRLQNELGRNEGVLLPEGVRLRSGDIQPGSLEVYVLRGGRAGPAESGTVFREGDRLQFVVHPGSYRYLHLFSLDAEGRLTWFYPEDGGMSLPLGQGNEIFLPGSIELDDYVGLERIEAVFSREAISGQAIERAVDALKAAHDRPLPLDRIPPLEVESSVSRTFLMVKE